MQSVVAAVATLLTREGNEDKSAEELAGEVVAGIFGALRATFKAAPPPLEVGHAYSFPWLPSTMHLIWQSKDGLRWFMNSTNTYGWLTRKSDSEPALYYRKLSRAKFLEAANDSYVVGDVVHLYGQPTHRYKVVAVASKTALLEGPKAVYTAFPFDELTRYFRFTRKKERNQDGTQ